MIDLTNAAALKLESLITGNEVVRLAVEGGGCAGFSYEWSILQ